MIQGTPCEGAIRRAMQTVREIVSGTLAPIDGARAIAWFGSADCYDFLQTGNDVVDEMAGWWSFVNDWEERQDDDTAKAAISNEIRRAARRFTEQFG